MGMGTGGNGNTDVGKWEWILTGNGNGMGVGMIPLESEQQLSFPHASSSNRPSTRGATLIFVDGQRAVKGDLYLIEAASGYYAATLTFLAYKM